DDTSWLLYISENILQQQSVYQNAFEPTPPMIMLFNCIPILLSQVTGISVATAFKLAVLLTAAGTVWLLYYLGRGLQIGVDRASHGLLIVAAALSFVILHGPEFGQRDSLIIMCLLPWICAAANLSVNQSMNNPGLLAIAGLVAAIGVAIKPQYLLIPLFVQTWIMWKQRSFRSLLSIDIVVAVALMTLYLIGVLVFEPDYFATVVPMVAATYPALDSGWRGVARFAWPALIWLPMLMLTLPAQATPWTSAQISALRLSFLAALLIYFQGHKPWMYHLLAAIVLVNAVGAIAVPVFVWRERSTGRRNWLGVLGVLACAIAFAPSTLQLIRESRWDYQKRLPGGRPLYEALEPIVKALPPSTSFACLSMNMNCGFPLALDTGREWAVRYPFLLPLAKVA